MEIGFHVSDYNTQFNSHIPDKFTGYEDIHSTQVSNQTLLLMEKFVVGREVAIVTFEDVTILTPRGQFDVELYLSFLRMQREGNVFEIPYNSVLEIFVLPKCRRPYTFVVITLDPSISKCQTLFPHIVIQFDTDYEVEKFLVMNHDLYSTIYKDKLEPSYKGPIHEVFTTILQGLYKTKLTKPGEFRSHEDSYAVETSLIADDGLLYPLENCFFFLPLPPTAVNHDEINYVKFKTDVYAGPDMDYFDLIIKLKTNQEHLFHAIPGAEYNKLFDYISSKGLHIISSESVEEAHEEELALSSF